MSQIVSKNDSKIDSWKELANVDFVDKLENCSQCEVIDFLEEITKKLHSELNSNENFSFKDREKNDLIRKIAIKSVRYFKKNIKYSSTTLDSVYLYLSNISNEIDRIYKNDPVKLKFSDLKFAKIISVIAWSLSENSKVNWDDKKTFASTDKDFYFDYFKKITKKHHIIPVLAMHADGLTDIDYNSLEVTRTGFKFFHEIVKRSCFVKKIKPKEFCYKFKYIKEKKVIYEHKKFTIQQFCLVDKLGSLTELLNDLLENDLIDKKIFQDIKNINDLIKLKECVKSEFLKKSYYLSGDIAFLNVKRDALSRGKEEPDLNSKIQMLVTNSSYGHPLIVLSEKNKVVASHVVESHHFDELSLHEFVSYDFFRFEIFKLISDYGIRVLEEMYAGDWFFVAQEVYESTTKTFHDTTNFSDIKNIESRRNASVFKSHKLDDKCNIENFQFVEAELFCSEFIGLTIASCLKIMEKTLKSNYQKYLVEHDEFTESQAIRASKKFNFINPVFKKHENFEAMHPGYLYKTLENYIAPIPKPEFVTQFIKNDQF
ncbi:MAG: hypothetical protein V4494_03735 [Chlamydiota bacterium]